MTDPERSTDDRERTDGGIDAEQPAERMVVDDELEQRMDSGEQSPQPPTNEQTDTMQPRETRPVPQDQQQDQQQGQQPPQRGQPRPAESGQRQQSPDQPPQRGQQQSQQQPPQQSPQDNVQLDPWEIHDNIVNSMNKSETAFIDTEWGELRYTVQMPDKGIYQAAVGSLPDELMEWMTDVADEYGNDADLDDLIRRNEVDPPRIVFGEKVMDTFDRLLRECIEHDPKSGNPDHKLTQTPTNDIIRGMDPNQQTVPLGFQCIRLGSERSGIRGFRMEQPGA